MSTIKKIPVALFVIAAVISTPLDSPGGDKPRGGLAYAANTTANSGSSNQLFLLAETARAEFAYEAAELSAKIIAAPTTSSEEFKRTFAYATAQAMAKVMPLLPQEQRKAFAYEMAQITTAIIIDSQPDIEKHKAEFSYRMAQLTSRMLTGRDYRLAGGDTPNGGRSAVPKDKDATNTAVLAPDPSSLLRNNAEIEPRATTQVDKPAATQKKNDPGAIDPKTYASLIDELTHPANRRPDKLHIDGELRYHYAWNNAATPSRDLNSSGLRLYLGMDAAIYRDWRLYGRLEGNRTILNYDNNFSLSRLYLTGKLGAASLTAGSFSYLMAEGNIYDSGFDGIRVAFDRQPLTYSVSLGTTDDTKNTAVATVRYEDFDYDAEAGIYHYQTSDSKNNTIQTIGGNYKFSNFSIGAMALTSSLKDAAGNRSGYVFSLNYGDAKSWMPGSYGLFSKYYNQPRYTYIAHGMNGLASRMDGFRGYGLGMDYAVAENLIAGLEYYRLREKTSGERGTTWWSYLDYFF